MASKVDLRDSTQPLPEYLLLDASVLLRVNNADVSGFLQRVRQGYQQGTVYPLMCLWTLEECYHTLIRRAYQKHLPQHRTAIARKFGKKPSQLRWHHLYKQRPRIIRKEFSGIEAFRLHVAGFPIQVLEPEDLGSPGSPPLEDRMRHYMKSACILGHDAYLEAVAERLEARHIATLDGDFCRLDSAFTVYTLL